jgi:hypothetical protein
MKNLFDDSQLYSCLNSRGMNRQRSLLEYNSELCLDIKKIAEKNIQEKNKFVWYDLCCGYFCARDDLINCLEKDTIKKIKAIGVDLDVRTKDIINENVCSFEIPSDANLVTCLQGLNYVQTYLKKGVETIENWYNYIDEGCILAFDIAKNHIKYNNKDISYTLKEGLENLVDIFETPSGDKNRYTIHMIKGKYDIEFPKPISRSVFDF